jgi:hypothetical protein
MESGVALLPDLISSSSEVVYTVSDLNYPSLHLPHPQSLCLHGGPLEKVSVLELMKGSKVVMHTPCFTEAQCVLLSGKLPPWDPFHEQKLVNS